MQRFGMKFAASIVFVCGIIMILSGFKVDSEREKDAGLLAESAGSQLELLYSLGEAHIDSPLRLTIKLQGESPSLTDKEAEQAANLLAEEIGLNDLSAEIEQHHGGKAYRGRETMADTDIRLDWVQAGERSLVKVQLDTDDPEDLQYLIGIQEKAEEAMRKAGMIPVWNASIQGNVDNGITAGETISSLENKLATNLSFHAVDSYQDVTTESRSYEVPSLDTYVMSGDRPIHMQLAVHEDSIKENNRITIGFPVITIEY